MQMSLNRGNNIQAKVSIFPHILKVGWPPASLVRFSFLSRRVREPVKYYLLDFFDKAPFLDKKVVNRANEDITEHAGSPANFNRILAFKNDSLILKTHFNSL